MELFSLTLSLTENRIYMKKLVFLIVGLSFVVASIAQKAQNETAWKVSLSKANFELGEEIEVIITVNINDGWHLYASDFDPNCGPLPTTIKFTSNDSYTPVGDLTSVDARKFFDEIFECNVSDFSHVAVFKQKIKVLDKTLVLDAIARYQICESNGMCLMGTHLITDSFESSSPNTNTIHVIDAK